jgi:hypothetical protein
VSSLTEYLSFARICSFVLPLRNRRYYWHGWSLGARTITQRDTAHLDMIRFPRISRDYSTQKKKKKKKKTEKVRQSVTSDQQKYRNFLKTKN